MALAAPLVLFVDRAMQADLSILLIYKMQSNVLSWPSVPVVPWDSTPVPTQDTPAPHCGSHIRGRL